MDTIENLFSLDYPSIIMGFFIIILGGIAGALPTLYIIVSLFGTIFYKIYRSVKYNISLYS